MDELNDRIVSIRADTSAFARDVAVMRGELEGPFAGGIDRAGRAIETSLLRAIRTGKLGFEDLKSVALSVLAEIAASAIRSGIGAILGGGQPTGHGGLLSQAGSILGGVLGLPGRATGGPVGPGRAYVVGERGPEVFVPTAAGRVEANPGQGGGRMVNITVNVGAPREASAAAMQQTGNQVARAVARALDRARP